MSALGHKRTFAVQNGMSALPPIADICSAQAHVCFVPKRTCYLFDHLVGAGEQLRWNFKVLDVLVTEVFFSVMVA